jgi:aldehyde dehydrogenase (NAD(P)+)
MNSLLNHHPNRCDEQGRANKAAHTPINTRQITSELGAVCPTIVVPGPWSAADIRFQGEQVATQKLHNSMQTKV